MWIRLILIVSFRLDATACKERLSCKLILNLIEKSYIKSLCIVLKYKTIGGAVSRVSLVFPSFPYAPALLLILKRIKATYKRIVSHNDTFTVEITFIFNTVQIHSRIG